MKNPNILSFDPGLANTGWSVVNRKKHSDLEFTVDASGMILTKSECPLGDRLKSIHDRILEIIKIHRPDIIAIEAVFFNKNVTSCLSTAKVIAIIEYIAACKQIRTLILTPQQVKASVGNSKATKAQMQKVLSKMVGFELKNPHITDAIGCGIAAILKATTLKEKR